MERYECERCGDCGRGLTWIEIAFGRFNDPVCGRCLMERNAARDRGRLMAGDDGARDTIGMPGSETDVAGGL